MVKQERALRTRRALVRAAAEVFAEEGFAPASLTAISRRAGVSNGALHFHFPNKKALARAVEEEALETVRGITGRMPDEEGSALQMLVDVTHGLASRLAEDVVLRAGFGLGRDPSRGRNAGSELRLEWWKWVEECLRRAERQGLLAGGVSAEGAARAIVATLVGFEVLEAGGDGKGWLSERSVSGFWELMLPRLAERHALASVTSTPTRRDHAGA